ncbi:UDP-glycosyltransferase TURAN-like isoform X3 [Olea europaea subsp. europaea]|uniref:UDP-glycosyltransferase TURAN-like isoform X3 n=1 Tax=Olea europaea subsp. europaea TaxID=158383 RepID=A0A8S0RS55_OLEEU|nr:UDP-glycosyltransferase TURAN-like isoform X3 [Olea europaea subsp. europaea]
MFQDITTLLLDPKAFKDTIDLFVERYKDQLKLMLLQPQWPTSGGSLPKILHPLMLMLKLIVQFLLLLWYICMKIPVPDVFMVQVTVLENSSMYVLLPSTGVAVEFASQYRRSNLHNQIVNGKYKLWSHGMFCTHSFALE